MGSWGEQTGRVQGPLATTEIRAESPCPCKRAHTDACAQTYTCTCTPPHLHNPAMLPHQSPHTHASDSSHICIYAQAFRPKSSGPLWFGLPIPETLNSLISLTVKADSLTLVANVAPGLVLSAVLCTFDNASCGSFTALNQRGYVHTVFKNIGTIDSSYTVEVCAVAMLLTCTAIFNA